MTYRDWRIIRWAVAIILILFVAVWAVGTSIIASTQIKIAVYDSSSIVSQYWSYKRQHGTWPAPGIIRGYLDARFIRSDSFTKRREDVFSFYRSDYIVISLDGDDVIFATVRARE